MTANTVFAAGSLVGAPVRRVEDPDLLTGRATYIDNLQVDGMLELAFVRSTVAHANLVSIDTSEARGMPGVVGVYTASDIDVPEYFLFMKINPAVTRPSLAQDRVRFVGDIIAVVVADTRAQAVDAAEAVIVDYDPLPAVTDLDDALAPDAPLLFEELGSNVCGGNRGNPGDPLEDAEVVVRGRFVNQRVAVVPMEGAAVAVVPGDDGFGNEVVMHLACQMPHMTKMLAAGTIGVDMDKLRVIAPHVGGSFGAKHFSAEALVAARLARELNRPIRWVESRSENMIGMTHGRSQVQYVELGLKRDGTITGMRCRVIGDAGAYGGFGGTLAMGSTRTMAQGVYHIPKIGFDVVVALTNGTPLGAYRGAGRPEAASLVERILDMAADELDMDPIELRRKNLIQPDEFPYDTVTGVTYDIGDYDAPLREAIRIAGYDALLADQAARRERGDVKQLGIGVCLYVEVTGGAGGEFSEVEIHDDGSATLKAGTSAHGQGHATAYSSIVSDRLGIPLEKIRFIQSDTALVAHAAAARVGRGHSSSGGARCSRPRS